MLSDFFNQLRGTHHEINELYDVFNLKARQERFEYLQKKMQHSTWTQNDIEERQEAARLYKQIEYFETLWHDFNELCELTKCAIEDKAEDVLPILEMDYEHIQRQLQYLRQCLVFSGKYDANNVILSIQAGAGGKEAQDWCRMLIGMYAGWAAKHDFHFEILDWQDGEDGSVVKSATVGIKGENVYGLLKNEQGIHRMVRVSPFDSQNRRHTSFAAVEIMPEIELDTNIELDMKDVRIDTFRSSGKGGQHVNKTDSAIRLTHIPTGLVVACQQERSQHQNKEKAIKMLLSKLTAIKEQENYATLADIKGPQNRIEWGNQIRSYVFMPYQMVKDHRTNFETSNIAGVMDGDIDAFIWKSLAE